MSRRTVRNPPAVGLIRLVADFYDIVLPTIHGSPTDSLPRERLGSWFPGIVPGVSETNLLKDSNLTIRQKETSAYCQHCGAPCRHSLALPDPRLERLIAVWPELTEAIHRVMEALCLEPESCDDS